MVGRIGRFTLVEMMVVIAIIAVLVAIAVPKLYEMQMRARRAEVYPNALSLLDALIAYGATHGIPDVSPATFTDNGPSGVPGKTRRTWDGGAKGYFALLGWRPDGDVYADYAFNGYGTDDGADCYQYWLNNNNIARLPGGAVTTTARYDLDGDFNAIVTRCCEGGPTGGDFPYERRDRCGNDALGW